MTWRDIATAPKDGTEFLAHVDGEIFLVQWIAEHDRFEDARFTFKQSDFTHWTDLPSPPSTDTEK